jgi:hypothetical protein
MEEACKCDLCQCNPCRCLLSESEKMQDELEPIYHPTEFDESDDLERTKQIWSI